LFAAMHAVLSINTELSRLAASGISPSPY